MNQKIKALFFDIDGTLYDNKSHALASQSLAAILKLKEKGYKTAICTSRNLAEMVHLPSALINAVDVVISGAGTVIQYQDSIDYTAIDATIIHKAFSFFEEHKIVYRWTNQQGIGYFGSHQEKTVSDLFYYLYQMIPGYQQYQGEPVTSILYYTDNPTYQQQLKTMFNDCECIQMQHSVEVTPPSMNKYHGIKKVLAKWQLTMDEAMAFGDGNNDYPMLAGVGFSVAMGNANERLKAVADYVTDSVENNGVHQALVQFNFID